MQADILLGRVKQLRQIGLGQPDGAVNRPQADLRAPVFGLIKDHFAAHHRALHEHLLQQALLETLGLGDLRAGGGDFGVQRRECGRDFTLLVWVGVRQ